MEFLREAIKRNARRLKLQQWLLLAVRTLLLLLLALAAAKPYLSGWNMFTGGPKVHRVLVIDGSYSMRIQEEGETLFDRATQLAQQAVERGPSTDVYSVCLMADTPQMVVPGPVAAASLAAPQISRLEPTFESANLSSTISTVQEAINNASAAQSDIASHEVMFFTDLTETSWNETTETAGLERVKKLAAAARLVVVDVGRAGAPNMAVSALELVGGLATTAQAVELSCQVANHSDSPAEDVTLQLVIDDLTAAEQTISLPARGEYNVAFEHKFTQPGWRRLAVRTAGDQLPADDQAWLAVDVRQQIRVLLVEGQRNAARYLRAALNPGGEVASSVRPVVVAEGSLIDTPLGDFDCVFLVDISQFTTRERLMLEDYTRQGGSVVFYLGDRVQPNSYNELARLLDSQQPSSVTFRLVSSRGGKSDLDACLLPATIGPLQSSESFGIDPLGYAHPIAKAFRGQEQTGLLSTPVTTYYQLNLRDDPNTAVALALPDGNPLLVTGKYGSGRVAMMATSASLETIDRTTGQPWTMLPAWPSFLPIVRELVTFCTSPDSEQTTHLVGQPIQNSLDSTSSSTTVALKRPGGRTDSVPVERRIRAQNAPFANEVRWTYASTNAPGIYTALPQQSAADASPNPGDALSMTAVNVDPQESNLSRIDLSRLPKSLAVRAASNISSRDASIVSDTSIHRPLLYAVLALVLLDSILAWWFGARSSR